jgi:hypothetical protein
LDLTKAVSASPKAKVKPGTSLSVQIERDTRPLLYAAKIPLLTEDVSSRFDPSLNARVPVGLRLQAQIKVTGGDIRVGVLTPDEKHFLVFQTVEESKEFATLDVPFTGAALGPVILAAGSTRPHDVIIELRDLSVVSYPLFTVKGTLPGLSEPPP